VYIQPALDAFISQLVTVRHLAVPAGTFTLAEATSDRIPNTRTWKKAATSSLDVNGSFFSVVMGAKSPGDGASIAASTWEECALQ